MPMQEDLGAAVQAAVGPGVAVEWGWSLQGSALPRVVMITVSGGDGIAHDGPTGLTERRVQVDVFAETYKEARDLADAIRRALHGIRTGALCGVFLAGVRDGQPDTPAGETLARISLDLRVHYQE